VTISLTPDELKDYRTRCMRWAMERADFVAKLLMQLRTNDPSRMYLDETPNRAADKKLAEWEATNPFPEILPRV